MSPSTNGFGVQAIFFVAFVAFCRETNCRFQGYYLVDMGNFDSGPELRQVLVLMDGSIVAGALEKGSGQRPISNADQGAAASSPLTESGRRSGQAEEALGARPQSPSTTTADVRQVMIEGRNTYFLADMQKVAAGRKTTRQSYGRIAWEFRQRAKTEGLSTKVDSEGVTRIYDPKSNTFAAYNRNGTTKTFFKPNNRNYFDRQPGVLIRPNGEGLKERACQDFKKVGFIE